MYKSKLLKYPDYDLTWFWDAVMKFNGIANPDGVTEGKQLPIIKSELQEILDSKSETEFMDGIIDGLVTLAPLVERRAFNVYYYGNYNTTFDRGYGYNDLEDKLSEYITEQEFGGFDHHIMVHALLSVLVCDECHYENNCESILASNMSKFIPIDLYHESHYAEVVAAYPQHTVTKVIREYEGEEFVVFFNENGKILKGHSYYFDPVLVCE